MNKTGNYRHGSSKTRLYRIWCNMKSRCNNENRKDFHRYGGRGIKVNEKWDKHYESFENWALTNGYNDNLTLERINNDDDYKSSNCKWIRIEKQALNRGNTIKIKFDGRDMYISELSQLLKIPETTIWYRYKNDIPINLDKRILQLDKNGEVINKYDNVEQAIKKTGFTSIRKVFQGKCKTAGGFHWRNARQDGTADAEKGYI